MGHISDDRDRVRLYIWRLVELLTVNRMFYIHKSDACSVIVCNKHVRMNAIPKDSFAVLWEIWNEYYTLVCLEKELRNYSSVQYNKPERKDQLTGLKTYPSL